MQHAPIKDDTADLVEIARGVLRDRYKPGAFINSLFSVRDWVCAAEYALCPVEPDFDDLRYYLAEDERAEAENPAETYADYADHMNDRRLDDRLVAQYEARVTYGMAVS